MVETITFDDLFHYTGKFGYFQIFQFLILGMIGIFGPEPVYVNFIAADLPHWCKVEGLNHLPYDVQKNVAIPLDCKYIWILFPVSLMTST